MKYFNTIFKTGKYILYKLKNNLVIKERKRLVHINDNKKFIFIGVYKAGYTSVYSSLYKHIDRSKLLTSEEINDNEFSDYLKFAFVRNPYDRIVSLYSNRKKVLKQKRINHPYKKYSHNLTFHEFVKLITSIPDYDADLHFRSQSYILMDKKGNLIPTLVGRFENFDADFKKICSITGINTPLCHKNKSKRKKSYESYYNKDTQKLIEKRYANDLKNFNYQF